MPASRVAKLTVHPEVVGAKDRPVRAPGLQGRGARGCRPGALTRRTLKQPITWGYTARLIAKLTGVEYHQGHVWRLLGASGIGRVAVLFAGLEPNQERNLPESGS